MAYRTSNGNGAFHWLFQRISVIFIAVILMIHLGAIHFGVSLVDLGSPSWKVFHFIFIVLLLYHILVGFWLIAEDYLRTHWIRISLYGLAWVVGLVFFILGFVSLVPFGS
jgi:succinate dehydrogenase hydrophobic anchor subunit